VQSQDTVRKVCVYKCMRVCMYLFGNNESVCIAIGCLHRCPFSTYTQVVNRSAMGTDLHAHAIRVSCSCAPQEECWEASMRASSSACRTSSRRSAKSFRDSSRSSTKCAHLVAVMVCIHLAVHTYMPGCGSTFVNLRARVGCPDREDQARRSG
jgi:hypothetical protein